MNICTIWHGVIHPSVSMYKCCNLISFQNNSLCLPAGLDCYTNIAPDNCNTPCKGIFADRTLIGTEDLDKNADFQAVYNEYKNYKSGFTKNEGTQ